MVRLIDDLLDVSRISRGKIELRKERVELAKVVQQAVETSRPLIEAGGHDLTIDVPPDPIYVDADVTRLAQVFANLLNNAAKYTERGGRIWLTVERQGSDAVVSVRDTGVGIPAHMLPKVFEMFTQVDRTLERSQGGLGIGLSLVKRLVEMHGGTRRGPERRSRHGQRVRRPPAGGPAHWSAERGTRPAARRSAATAAAFWWWTTTGTRPVSLAMMLGSWATRSRTAHDGLEALDVAAAFRPDVILLDIGMPKLNGYDTARRIRRAAVGQEHGAGGPDRLGPGGGPAASRRRPGSTSTWSSPSILRPWRSCWRTLKRRRLEVRRRNATPDDIGQWCLGVVSLLPASHRVANIFSSSHSQASSSVISSSDCSSTANISSARWRTSSRLTWPLSRSSNKDSAMSATSGMSRALAIWHSRSSRSSGFARSNLPSSMLQMSVFSTSAVWSSSSSSGIGGGVGWGRCRRWTSSTAHSRVPA